MARRRLTLQEYQEQLALLRDIASTAQDAARLCLTLWDVPHCITTIINAFFDLERMLFPQGASWDEKTDDASRSRRRIDHLTATEFWTKPSPPNDKMLAIATVSPWMRLHDTFLALLHHYDRVLADHEWGQRIANGRPDVQQPRSLSDSVARLANTADLLVDLAMRETDRLDAIDDPPKASPGQQDIESHMQRVVEAIGDDNATRILAIAHRADLSGEQKMEEILRLDPRFAGKDSPEWGKLLGVSPNAVRGYSRWKELQELKKTDN